MLGKQNIMAFVLVLGLCCLTAYAAIQPYLEDQRRFVASPIIALTMSVDEYLGFAVISQVESYQAILRSGKGINPNVLMVQFEAKREVIETMLGQIDFDVQDNTTSVLEYWTCKTTLACPEPWLVFKRPRTRTFQAAPRRRLFVYIDDSANQMQRVTIIKYIRV